MYRLVSAVVDLAASAGHHISGTSYHWHHGWVPRDQSTAAQYGKKFATSGKFFHEEPEEFNEATKTTPKFITSVPGGDTKPVMKYKGSKILTGTKHTVGGKTITVSKVSQSKTHVLADDGTKHKISSLKGKTQADKDALVAYQKSKFKKSIAQFDIHSSFKPPAHYKPIPKKSSIGSTPGGSVYYASPEKYDEPTFPRVNSLKSPNIEGSFTSSERNALSQYTGSGYASINGGLRAGKDNGHAKTIAALDTALGKAKPLTDGGVLHRGMNVAALQNLQPGDSFVDKGYASTSRNPTIGLAARSTRLHIETVDPKLKAVDVASVSNFPGEHEVLLPRNTKFTVTRRVQHGNHAHLYVHAEPAAAVDMQPVKQEEKVAA